MWEDEAAVDGLDPPGMPPSKRPSVAPGLDAPALFAPLAEASAALARLDARIEAADPAVAEGPRACLALREAAGWLAHQHGAWVHPTDLGLRAAGLTGSITIAAMSGRLRATLPTTTEDAPLPEALAKDLGVVQALQLGRLWLRLAEHRTWTPLADAASLKPLLAQLGHHAPTEESMAAWLSRFAGRPAPADATLPALLRTAQVAQAWSEHEPGQGRGDRLVPAALFLAACVWR